MLTNTARKYLAHAVEKAMDEPHKNFEQAAPKVAKLHREIGAILKEQFAATKEDVLRAITSTLPRLGYSKQAYTTFLKNLLSDAAFAAHMDMGSFERDGGAVDEKALDAVNGMYDALGEDHHITDDVPLFDKSGAARFDGSREEYEEGFKSAPDGVTATSIEDAAEAIQAVQTWLSLAIARWTPRDCDFWGMPGNQLPYMQIRIDSADEDSLYVPVMDFDAYRTEQTRQWKAKAKVAPTAGVVDLMDAAA